MSRDHIAEYLRRAKDAASIAGSSTDPMLTEVCRNIEQQWRDLARQMSEREKFQAGRERRSQSWRRVAPASPKRAKIYVLKHAR